jgi:hypothetical protein
MARPVTVTIEHEVISSALKLLNHPSSILSPPQLSLSLLNSGFCISAWVGFRRTGGTTPGVIVHSSVTWRCYENVFQLAAVKEILCLRSRCLSTDCYSWFSHKRVWKSRCLVIAVFSDFTIAALRCHVTLFSLAGISYKMGFGSDDWIYCALYIHTICDYKQYRAIAILHTFQFTVAHTLGLWAFTSPILVTGLTQSHCNFKSYMKSSW